MLIMEKNRGPFAEWLEKEYIKRQADLGERLSLEEFAIYVGISKSLLSQYMNGSKQPGARSLARIASVLGPEAYDALGLPRPPQDELDLRYILDAVDDMTEEELRVVQGIIERAEKRKRAAAGAGRGAKAA